MPFQVRAFGGLSLLDPDGEQIDAVQAHSKGAAVLAYLATRPVGEAVDRADLVPLLWPERPEEEGRASLRAVLKRLRDRLPDGAIGGKGENRLWLRESVVTSDVRAFQQALEEARPREALDLYRGPFLEHVQVSDASPFNRWAEERRSAYRRRAYEAALTVGEEAREAGKLEEAERVYRRAVDIAPLKEDGAAGLIRVLAAGGQRADALKFYASFRDRLEEELELTPSEELDELAERVRSRPAEGVGTKGGRERKGRSAGGGRTSAWWTSPRRLGAAVLAAAVVAVGLWLGFAAEGTGPDGGGEAAHPGGGSRPTVAVLPFENLGEAEDTRTALEGLHVSLLTRLSKVSGLVVLSRSSVTDVESAELSPTAVADSLGAEWVVEGEAQLVGDEIKVSAQLTDADTKTQAWAESYRRTLSAEKLFALQSEIAQRIAQSLETQLTSEEAQRIERQPTGNLEAYYLYAKGRRLFNQRKTVQMRRALQLFGRAIARDSSFALAWAGLSDAIRLHESYGYEIPNDAPASIEAARRALQLEPDLAEAHTSLGHIYVFRGNGPAALQHLRRAVRLKPSYAQGQHWLGVLYHVLGRPGRARDHLELAVQLSPRSWNFHYQLSRAYVATGRIDLAIREAEKALRLYPDPTAPLVKVHALLHQGRFGEVKGVARTVLERTDYDGARAFLALSLAVTGDTAEARDHLSRLEEPGGSSAEVGLVLVALGELDAAFRALSRSPKSNSHLVRYDLPAAFEAVGDDPRYRELIRTTNQAWSLNPDGTIPDSVHVSFSTESDD